jgi:hypothetical protein
MIKRLILLAAALTMACGGGGGDNGSPSTSSSPTSPTSPTATAPGEPTLFDWSELGAQLASIGTDQLVQALSASGASAVAAGPLDLRRPAQSVSRTAAYFCCGPQSSNTSHITVETTVTVPDRVVVDGRQQVAHRLERPSHHQRACDDGQYCQRVAGAPAPRHGLVQHAGRIVQASRGRREVRVCQPRIEHADGDRSDGSGQPDGAACCAADRTRTLLTPARRLRPDRQRRRAVHGLATMSRNVSEERTGVQPATVVILRPKSISFALV